ncbi:MAG: hypothetical protein AAF310_01670 [Myxococcota bacterium]
MVFSPKHLENLEHLNDSRDGGSSESEAQVGVDRDPVDPLAWRLKLIERAVVRVKKLHRTKLDPQGSYQVGELLFDDQAKLFARVQSSLQGLSLRFLSGGQQLYEMKQQPAVQEKKGKHVPAVVHTLPAASTGAGQLPAKVAVVSVAKSRPVVAARVRVEQAVAKTAVSRGNKSVVAQAATVNKRQKAAPLLASVQQRDAYIRAHYLKMGNKELARHTGLSEHTIRRKLGEWSLRRPAP